MMLMSGHDDNLFVFKFETFKKIFFFYEINDNQKQNQNQKNRDNARGVPLLAVKKLSEPNDCS